MGVQRFDEAALVGTLERLPPELRAAFAAVCAERLLPAYVAFSARTGRGQPTTLRSILTRLWDDLAGDRMTDGEIQEKIDVCMGLVPREDEGPWVEEQDFAEDGVAATAYALTCRQNGKAQEAMWSAQRAYNALDEYVINHENIDVSGTAAVRAPAEARVLAHPLMQAELARQRRDLDDLLTVGKEDQRRVVGQLRYRAEGERSIFFGSVL